MDDDKAQKALELWRRFIASIDDDDAIIGYYNDGCIFCGATIRMGYEPHEPDCLWLEARRLVSDG